MQRTSMELTFEIVLLTVIALLIVALSGLAIFLCRRRCKAVRHANHEEGTMVVINIDNGGDRKVAHKISRYAITCFMDSFISSAQMKYHPA